MKIRYILSALVLMACAIQCDNGGDDILTNPSHPEGRVTLEVYSDNPLLEMNESGESGKVCFKSRGGEVVVDVVSNQDSWSYETTDAEWLTIEQDNHFLTLKAQQNESGAVRTATVVISTGEERVESVALSVEQNYVGARELSFSQNQLRIKAHTELLQSVAVETNCEEWSVDTTCAWLMVEQTESGLMLTADDNTTTQQREAEIVISSGDVSDKLVVRQDGSAYVKFNTCNVVAGYDGATKQLVVDTNPELEWQFTSSGEEWFSAVRNDKGLSVTIVENSTKLQRQGTLTISVGYEGNYVEKQLTVLQIGTDTEALIYEVETVEPNQTIVAAPVLTSSGGGKIEVDWGDGSALETFESVRGSHRYAEPGTYTISITGEAHNLQFGGDGTVTSDLKNIISWGKLGYKNATDMCLGCVALESIPDDVAGSFTDVVAFVGAFSCCSSLKEIPAGLFRHATRAKRFVDCFSHSASITEIPEDLFASCTAAEDLSYAFYATGTGIVSTNNTLSNFSEVYSLVSNGGLKSIPEGLFRNCPNITKLNYIFGATAITSVPQGIFANNVNATQFTGAFSACVNLSSLPAKLLDKNTAALDIKYMFAGCSSLTDIPTGMFENCSAVTNLEYIFYRTGVKSLKRGVFQGLSSAKTIGAVFQNCTSLTDIEAGVFDGLTSAKSFRYCFADCTSLRTIPTGLFAGMSSAYEFTYTFHNTALESVPEELFADARDYSSADFTYMFSDCPNLKTVPAGLFARFTKVTSPGYRNLFDGSGVETIPAGLFVNSTAVSTGFESLFENCPELRTIEGSIFPATTSVSSIGYLFCNCPKLESIPSDLFAPFGTAKLKFTATFAACASLKRIPAELFAANTAATQFTETFADCSSLDSIPATLLANNPKVTNVKGMFQGCTSIKSVPEELFAATTSITSFDSTFAECSSLRTIPARLFSSIGTLTSSITFSNCFFGCSALTEIPSSLFDTVRRINFIDGCFAGCTSLTGESPYTMIGEQKVHLYERTRGDDFPNAPVSSSAHAECFKGCEKLSDYANMPTSWR